MRLATPACLGMISMLSGCFGLPTFSKQQTGRVAYQGPIDVAGTEGESGVVSATVSATSTLTQVLRASSASPIAAASVSFPPGSLALDTVITIEEGASLTKSSVVTTVGLTTEKIQAAAPAIVVSSSQPNDALVPFTIALPFNTGTGLFAQSPDMSKIVVIYHARKHAEAAYVAGLVPRSQLTFNDNAVLVTTTLFGSYQVIYTADEVTTATETKTEATIVTKRDEVPLPSVAENLASMFSMAVAHAAEMPTCDADHLNQLVYVEDTREFKVCRAAGWGTVSSLTGVTALTFPTTAGAANKTLKSDGNGGLVWADDLSGGGAGSITSSEITDGTISNIDIATNAAIAVSKIDGLGSLATKNTVGSSEITDASVTGTDIANGTITDAHINATAAISHLKISGLGTAASKNVGTSAGDVAAGNHTHTVTSVDIVDNSISNVDISASAAISGSKIVPNFTGTVTATEVEGTSFVKTGTTIGTPDAMECDQGQEYGRLVVDTTNNRLYVCSTSGWVLVGPPDPYEARPALVFTTTAVAAGGSDASKNNQCATEYGAGYTGATMLDSMTTFKAPDLGATTLNFNVVGNTSSMKITSTSFSSGTGASYPVACINVHAPLRFTKADVAVSAADGTKDSTCMSEYGSFYEAATFAQTIALARYTPMFSGYVAATVRGDSANMLSFGAPSVTLAASAASVKVACRYAPQD